MNLFEESELFIGPLPEEAYRRVTDEFNLFRQDRLTELAARALYSYKKQKDYGIVLEGRLADNELDELTGLYRRDAVYMQLQNMICGLEMGRRSSDSYDSLAVLFMDVDEFKKINDESWAQGNKALKTVGTCLTVMTRSGLGDIPGRIGGDEFILITPFNAAQASEKQILYSLEDRLMNFAPSKFKELPSLKWHHAFYRPGDTAESLIERAEPKGDNKDLARSHSQSELQYRKSLKLAVELAA